MRARAPSAVLCIALCACAKRPVDTAPEARGEVSYNFLATMRSPTLAADEELSSPQPVEQLALPSYPAHALAARPEPATVVVRIVIGTDGTVTEVTDSPRLASSPSRFAADFRQAVEEAVRTWRFTGGFVARYEPGEDYDGDGEPDYRIATSVRRVAVFYDVAFEFSIGKDGTPRVTTSAPRP